MNRRYMWMDLCSFIKFNKITFRWNLAFSHRAIICKPFLFAARWHINMFRQLQLQLSWWWIAYSGWIDRGTKCAFNVEIWSVILQRTCINDSYSLSYCQMKSVRQKTSSKLLIEDGSLLCGSSHLWNQAISSNEREVIAITIISICSMQYALNNTIQ